MKIIDEEKKDILQEEVHCVLTLEEILAFTALVGRMYSHDMNVSIERFFIDKIIPFDVDKLTGDLNDIYVQFNKLLEEKGVF